MQLLAVLLPGPSSFSSWALLEAADPWRRPPLLPAAPAPPGTGWGLEAEGGGEPALSPSPLPPQAVTVWGPQHPRKAPGVSRVSAHPPRLPAGADLRVLPTLSLAPCSSLTCVVVSLHQSIPWCIYQMWFLSSELNPKPTTQCSAPEQQCLCCASGTGWCRRFWLRLCLG